MLGSSMCGTTKSTTVARHGTTILQHSLIINLKFSPGFIVVIVAYAAKKESFN